MLICRSLQKLSFGLSNLTAKWSFRLSGFSFLKYDRNSNTGHAVLAEKNGFDQCWVSHDVFMRSSFVTLTSIADHTNRMILENTILNPYTTNPAEIAMFIALLDELINGRAVCGISAGALE